MNLDKINPIKLNEQVTQLTEANAQLTEQLEVKDKALIEFKEQAKADAEAFANEKADLVNQIETLKTENINVLESLKAEHEKTIESLKAEVTKANESAEQKAAQLVTSMGIEVNTVKETISSDLSPAQIIAKFNGMTAGVERTAYYNKHKAVISGQVGVNK